MKYSKEEIMKGLDHCYHLSRSYLKEINDGNFGRSVRRENVGKV